jgi:hypothetical protein
LQRPIRSYCNALLTNEDFKKQHLLWDATAGSDPIILLVSENIAKQRELADRKRKLAIEKDARSAAADTSRRHNETITSAESICATQIVRELSAGRFDRRHVRQVVGSWNGDVPEPLTEELPRSDRQKLSTEQRE